MTKRYYISRVLGDGSIDNRYRSELRNYIYATFGYGVRFLKQLQHPHGSMWCIHKYDLTQEQHDTVMANVPQVFAFPSGALDRELSEIPASTRDAIKTKLESIGFDFDWATLSHTVRDVLKYVCHSIQLASWARVQITSKNFDMNTTVGNIPAESRQRIARKMQDLGIDTSWIAGTNTVSEIVTKIMFHSSTGQPRLFGTVNRKQWFWHDEDSE